LVVLFVKNSQVGWPPPPSFVNLEIFTKSIF